MLFHGKTFGGNRLKIIKGFSLLELCLVIAIIGILTLAAIPFYTQHMVRSHRIEAEITLKKIASQLEEFYTSHNSYEGITLEKLGVNSTKFYAFQLNSNETEYALTAEPLGTQVSQDSRCQILKLSSTGEIGISGTGNIQECW